MRNIQMGMRTPKKVCGPLIEQEQKLDQLQPRKQTMSLRLFVICHITGGTQYHADNILKTSDIYFRFSYNILLMF